MISETVWVQGCKLLAERYRSELSTEMAQVYLEALQAELNDYQFINGIKGVIRYHEFFPTIQQIIDRGRPPAPYAQGGKIEGERIFYAFLASPSGYSGAGGNFWSAAAIESKYGVAAGRAFHAIGGNQRIKQSTTENAHYLARDFGAAYAEALALVNVGVEFDALDRGRPYSRVASGPESLSSVLVGYALPEST